MPNYSRRSYYSGRGTYYRGRGTYYRGRGSYQQYGPMPPGANYANRNYYLPPVPYAPPASSTPWGDIGSSLGRGLFGGIAKYFGSGKYRRSYTKKPKSKKYGGKGAYKRISGRGAYSFTGSSVMAPTIPRFSKSGGDDSIIVSHSEYIGDIISASTANTFNVQSFKINPGDRRTFKWLSILCQGSFQQWEALGIVFEFRSTSGSALNSTNTALGVMVAAVNYDANDADFTSRIQMENSQWCQTCAPYQNCSIPVECDPKMNPFKVMYIAQQGATPTGVDKNSIYLGRLYIATDGLQGTSVKIGSLYVTYKIKLFKPLLLTPNSQAHYAMFNRTGTTSSAPLGTAFDTTSAGVIAQSADTIGTTFNGTTGTIMTLSKDRLMVGMRFLIHIEFTTVSGLINVPAVALSSNASLISGWGFTGSTFGSDYPTAGTTDTKSGKVFAIFINNVDNDITMTLSLATFPAGGTPNTNIHIWEICGLVPNQIGFV